MSPVYWLDADYSESCLPRRVIKRPPVPAVGHAGHHARVVHGGHVAGAPEVDTHALCLGDGLSEAGDVQL
jgi:hypothetical protein